MKDIKKVKELLSTFDYDKNTNIDLYNLIDFIICNYFTNEYISRRELEDFYEYLKERESKDNTSNEYDKPSDLIDDLLTIMEER